jgi:hypothetical protein
MVIRSWMRSIEQRCLRPLGRLMRRSGRRAAGGSDRLSTLERKVEELEGLVRELSGLAYLRLDEASPDVPDQLRAGAGQDISKHGGSTQTWKAG